jgi:hypothetical protein
LTNANKAAKKMSKKKKAVYFFGIIMLMLIGLSGIIGGATIMYLNTTTDHDGYTVSNVYHIESNSSAFVFILSSRSVSGYFAWMGLENLEATKWIVTSVNGTQIVAGWANSTVGMGYVNQFKHQMPTIWGWSTRLYYSQLNINSTYYAGSGTASSNSSLLPQNQTFWINSILTDNTGELYFTPYWNSSEGYRTLIVMNADGSNGVYADIQVCFKVPLFAWLPYLLIPVGAVFCIGGYAVIRKYRKTKRQAPTVPETANKP